MIRHFVHYLFPWIQLVKGKTQLAGQGEYRITYSWFNTDIVGDLTKTIVKDPGPSIPGEEKWRRKGRGEELSDRQVALHKG